MRTTCLVTFTLLLATFGHLRAQYALQTGKMQINGGFILSQGLPVYAGIDYGFDKNISLGGELTLSFYRSMIAANANYHLAKIFGIDDNIFDVYGGVTLGLMLRNQSFDAESGPVYYSNSPVNFGIQIGGRYYFKKNLAVNLELGGGIAHSGIKTGISYLLK